MYTTEFIARVENTYGKDSEIAKMAREAHPALGRWLCDSANNTLSADFCLSHTYTGILNAAKLKKEKCQLYTDYLSGAAQDKHIFESQWCPANYMQNISHPRQHELEKKLCAAVDRVGPIWYFPGCERYSCKEECWKKYHEMVREDKE